MKGILLLEEIRAKEMTLEDLARGIGISLSCFQSKLNNLADAEFSLGEIRGIKVILGLTSEQVDIIFFDREVS